MAAESEKWVVAKIMSIPGYEDLFQGAFPRSKKAITYTNVVTAIGAFERTLVSPSRFDRFIGGDILRFDRESKNGRAAITPPIGMNRREWLNPRWATVT